MGVAGIGGGVVHEIVTSCDLDFPLNCNQSSHQLFGIGGHRVVKTIVFSFDFWTRYAHKVTAHLEVSH